MGITSEKRKYIQALKKGPCKDCGGKFPPRVMHFDHRDPFTKQFDISRIHNKPLETIMTELQKVDLVCANCHGIRTDLKSVRIGLARAKAQGKTLGRPKRIFDRERAKTMLETMSVREVARQLGVSRGVIKRGCSEFSVTASLPQTPARIGS